MVSIWHYCSHQPQLQPQVVVWSVSFIITHTNHSFSHKWYYGQYPSLSLTLTTASATSGTMVSILHYRSHQPQLQPQVVLWSVSGIMAHTNHSFRHKWYYGQYRALLLTPITASGTSGTMVSIWHYCSQQPQLQPQVAVWSVSFIITHTNHSFSHKWYYGQYPSLSLTLTTASATSGTMVSILHYRSHQPQLQPQVVLWSVSGIMAHTNHSFSHKWYYGQYPSLSLTPTTASATSGTMVSIRHNKFKAHRITWLSH